ncbi:MAG TPA: hypothetical protein VD886_01895, partial [Herpetosiphonaceae bacterium]|nr:hypothetical protein [Herpetosiphonaceae bacterium]
WVFSTNGRAFVQYDRLTHARSGPLPLAMFPTPQELAAAYQPDQAIDSPVLSPGLAHPASARRLDRADPAVAQAVIERLLAPTDRPSVVYLLVQSIQQVHTVHPGCWSLTLDSTYIRLNIGKMEVCAIFPGQGRLILDVAALTDAAQVQAEQYALLSQPGVYQTVPTSMLCDGLAEHVPALLPIVRSSYDSLLQKAAQTVKRRTKYAASHASGLVQYLRQATGLDVPNPIYD